MNVYIRNLYSPGLSVIMFSFYKTNLSLACSSWEKDKFISTTISDESVATLYFLAKKIIEEKFNTPLQYAIPCNQDTIVVFEYNQGQASLTIEKPREKILFEFVVHRYKVKEKGMVVERTVQSGLIAFAKVLDAYLTAIAAERQNVTQEETCNCTYNNPDW